MNRQQEHNTNDFSITNGGPTYWLMKRIGLSRSLAARAAMLAAITWLPLLALSLFHGVAIGNLVRLPFLLDIAAHVRFLIAVPLLILAERTVSRILGLTVWQFTASNLIREDERPEFESAVRVVIWYRDSILPEALLLALAFIGSLTFGRGSPTVLSSWHERVWWYNLISIPIYQFLLYRWLWRYAIWSGFLWRVSRLNLQTVATHPDQRGGLAFIAMGQATFFPVVLSSFIVIAGVIAVSVIYAGKQLPSYLISMIAITIVVVLLFIGPLFFFTPQLVRLKAASIFEYGVLAARYTQSFYRKWVLGEGADENKLLGSSDIQSLADLSTSYDLVSAMKVFIFGLPTVLVYLLSAIAPLLLLAFLVLPTAEVSKALLRILQFILG